MNRYRGLKEQKPLPKSFILTTLDSPISLSDKKIGKFEVKTKLKKRGDILTIVSARNWLMMGYKQTRVELPHSRIIHSLSRYKEGLMMSDSPQEMFLQYKAYQEATGKVLVGGLGLGMYASMIAKKPEVKEITVIEIEKDIIELCQPKNKKIEVIHDDIWKFSKSTKEKFDYIYIDIHYRTGAMEYINTVLPMRKILKKRFPNTPASFWGEEEMEAQYDPDYKKDWVNGKCECGCGKLAKEGNRFIFGHATKGTHLSAEHRRKIREGNKGKKVSEETRQKMSTARTKEERSKMKKKSWDRNPNQGNAGKSFSPETKQKIGKSVKKAWLERKRKEMIK